MELLGHSTAAPPGTRPAPVAQLPRGIPRPAYGYGRRDGHHSYGARGYYWPSYTAPGNYPYQGRGGVARAAASATQTSLCTGQLVVYNNNGGSRVGLVVGLDGKAKYWVLGEGGRRTSISSKQVHWKLPGTFTEGDLERFLAVQRQGASITTDAISQALQEAWEMAEADSISTLSLSDLAGLVLEDDTPLNLFRMNLILTTSILFKPAPIKVATSLGLPAYEPRARAEVEQLQKQAQLEKEAAADRSAWAAATKQSLGERKRSAQPSPEAWASGPHAHRIAALKELALKPTPSVDPKALALASESLQLAGVRPPAPSAPPTSISNLVNIDGFGALSDAAAALLVDLRALRQHEPLAVLRRGVQLGEFPRHLEEYAQALASDPGPDDCAPLRLDLTHLRTLTIDDEGTTEVDDGLSVQLLDTEGPLDPATSSTSKDDVDLQGVRVWVHVADPTRHIPLSGPGVPALLEEARSRSRTLYFPHTSAPMFPRVLAEGPFSLREGEECCALSVGATLRPDGSIGDVQIVPTRVRVSHKLTYLAADALLEQAAEQQQPSSSQQQGAVADLVVLRAAADARRRYREHQGCIEIPLPEAKVTVPGEDLDAGRPRVAIHRISQWESPSRGLVAEMMIIAGEAAGRLGMSRGLPLPYRGQPQPSLPPPSELEALPSGICRGFALRRCMTKSSIAPQPHPHASLGLSSYVQVTSPIRRYADLVAHYQLKAHVRGAALPFGASDVEALNAAGSSERMRTLGQAERAEEQYWVCEYFRQRSGSGQEWQATVLGWVRQDLKLAAVLLDELGLEAVVKVDVEQLSPGDYVTLGLLEANPVTGSLRFTVNDYSVQSTAADEVAEGVEGDEDEEEEGEEEATQGEEAAQGFSSQSTLQHTEAADGVQGSRDVAAATHGAG